MVVWVRNKAAATRSYEWSVTGRGGAALPEGWMVSFREPGGALEPAGTRRGSTPNPADYPDWGWTFVTVKVPPSQGEGRVPAELHAGGATRSFTFVVAAERGAVSRLGERINTCYDLKGEDGTPIQKGPFPLTVGADGAVTGYAFGVAGLALGETADLVVPPPLAYGYDFNDLSGQTLQWTVRHVADPAECPRS